MMWVEQGELGLEDDDSGLPLLYEIVVALRKLKEVRSPHRQTVVAVDAFDGKMISGCWCAVLCAETGGEESRGGGSEPGLGVRRRG